MDTFWFVDDLIKAGACIYVFPNMLYHCYSPRWSLSTRVCLRLCFRKHLFSYACYVHMLKVMFMPSLKDTFCSLFVCCFSCRVICVWLHVCCFFVYSMFILETCVRVGYLFVHVGYLFVDVGCMFGNVGCMCANIEYLFVDVGYVFVDVRYMFVNVGYMFIDFWLAFVHVRQCFSMLNICLSLFLTFLLMSVHVFIIENSLTLDN